MMTLDMIVRKTRFGYRATVRGLAADGEERILFTGPIRQSLTKTFGDLDDYLKNRKEAPGDE